MTGSGERRGEGEWSLVVPITSSHPLPSLPFHLRVPSPVSLVFLIKDPLSLFRPRLHFSFLPPAYLSTPVLSLSSLARLDLFLSPALGLFSSESSFSHLPVPIVGSQPRPWSLQYFTPDPYPVPACPAHPPDRFFPNPVLPPGRAPTESLACLS